MLPAADTRVSGTSSEAVDGVIDGSLGRCREGEQRRPQSCLLSYLPVCLDVGCRPSDYLATCWRSQATALGSALSKVIMSY